MVMKKWIYVGYFLTEQSRNWLLSLIKDNIPEGWKIYLDHMTYVFNDGSEETQKTYEMVKTYFGENQKLHIDAIGLSDRALAFRVVEKNLTKNALAHITIAVAPEAKPVESNYITNWEKIFDNGQTLEVLTTLKEYVR